jgi:hypothetical protein
MKTLLHAFILFVGIALTPHLAQATHYGGGEISYRCLGFSQYEITITYYEDCNFNFNPITSVGLSYESTSCGMAATTVYIPLDTFYDVSPLCAAVLDSSSCNGGSLPGVRKTVYIDTLTLPANCVDWELYTEGCCRNNATVNLANPSSQWISVEAGLDNISYLCNSNTRFESIAVGYAQLGQPFFYDPRGVDDDGDVLKYRFVSALGQHDIPLMYVAGTSGQQPVYESFVMDSLTGRFTYTPTVTVGDFVLTYLVDEYRNGNWIGSTQREVRIVVINDGGTVNNVAPTSTLSNVTGGFQQGNTITVCAGQALSFDFTATDPDIGDTLQILDYDVYNKCPGATFTSTGISPVVGTFNWTPQGGGIYKVGLVTQDVKCPIIGSHQLTEITIIVQSSGVILGQSDQFLCSSPSITLDAYGNFGTYLWNTGDTTASISVTTAGVYSVSVNGACGPSTASIEIFDYPQVVINGGNNDTTIVQGDSLSLMASLGNGLTSDLFFSTDTTQLIAPSSIAVIDLPVSNIFPTQIDSTTVVDVCVTVLQLAGAVELYLIAPNGAMLELSKDNGGFASFDRTCFSINATDLITNYHNGNLYSGSNLPADSSFVPQGDWQSLYGGPTSNLWQLAIRQNSSTYPSQLNDFSIQFGGGYDYTWTAVDSSLSCLNCPNPTVAPDTTTSYIVQMTDGAGCTSYDTLTVTVLRADPIDTIYVNVQPDSTVMACANIPSFMGPIVFEDLIEPPFYGIYGSGGSVPANCVEYDAFVNNIVDTLVLAFCDNAGICDTNVFIFTVGSCVWAGDTDTTQTVNNFDLLPIGLGYGEVDYVRPNADLLFDCEPNRDWTNSTPLSNINYKHSDCDGNGIVNADDTMAISLNWGQFYVKNNSTSSSNSIPLYTDYYQTVEGATIQVPIILGDSLNPVDSAYGIAFTINYDPTLVDTHSVSVNFMNSWFGQINTDMISVSKDFYTPGQIQVGLTRIDHTYRSGMGQIGAIQMTIKDDIIKKSANTHLNMFIDNVRLISDQEVEISTVPVYTYVLIVDTTVTTSLGEIETGEKLLVYPNPASSTVHLESTESILQQVEVFNVAGQRLMHKTMQSNQHTIPVADLSEGIYLLRVQTDKGLHQKRMIVRR